MNHQSAAGCGCACSKGPNLILPVAKGIFRAGLFLPMV